ncbi:MAG TPA: dTDP-4-dehydrorhamnose reductase [Methylomirabilota bacterium]|nr:dTDP-4-dehydrorhamnose reductase [Methylomirabilota bacterium]
MRILVMGAKGMLGTDMLREWKSDDVIAADSAEADIRDLPQVRKLVASVRPDWIVLTAAYTDVDGSEKNRDLAFAVNATGAENVASAAAECGSRLFFVSTDYVFDGNSTRPYEPDDPIHPLNVYGASKAAGESGVRQFAKQWCIGRTSWLFGAYGPSFPEKILRASETRPELAVVSDQVGSPTFTRDLAGAMLQLIHAGAQGTFHITNSGTCSWFEFAREVLNQAGRGNVPVKPVSSSEFPRPATRPSYSILSPASLNRSGITMRHWKDAVTIYLQDLRAAGKLS